MASGVEVPWSVVIAAVGGYSVFLVSTTALIVARIRGWNKGAEAYKIIKGDEESSDQLANLGLERRQAATEKAYAHTSALLKAFMRGVNLPTDVSDPRELKAIVKEMHQRGELFIEKAKSGARVPAQGVPRTEITVVASLPNPAHDSPLPPPARAGKPLHDTRHRGGKISDDEDED